MVRVRGRIRFKIRVIETRQRAGEIDFFGGGRGRVKVKDRKMVGGEVGGDRRKKKQTKKKERKIEEGNIEVRVRVRIGLELGLGLGLG